MDERGAARLGQDAAADADQTTRWDQEVNAGSAVCAVLDVLHARATLRHDPRDHTNKVNRDVNGELLKRLLNTVWPLMQENLRARHFKFEPFASHLLHEDCKLEFAASTHLERFARISWTHFNRRIAEHLLLKACLQLARRKEFSILATDRARVYAERHLECWRINVESFERSRICRVGDRLANLNIGETCNANNLTGSSFSNLNTLNPHRQRERRHRPADRALFAEDGDLRPLAHDPVANASNGDAPNEVICRKVRDQHL